jgi:hypothetical protein
MSSSGMLRRVALVRTDVSKERIAFVIRPHAVNIPEESFLRTLAYYADIRTLMKGLRVVGHCDQLLTELVQAEVCL